MLGLLVSNGDAAMTIFVPTDTAIDAALSAQGSSVTQLLAMPQSFVAQVLQCC